MSKVELEPHAVAQDIPYRVPEHGNATTTVASKVEVAGRGEIVEDGCPDGGYGWIVVICLVLMYAVSWGINNTYGVYSSSFLQNNYFANGSTFRYSWVGGLAVTMSCVSAPLANYCVNRAGFKPPMIFGAICLVLGQCLAGISTSFAGFIACQGIVFGLGLGFTTVPSSPLLVHWFDRHLALAEGLSECGPPLGALIFSNTTRLTLDTVGVKWSLVITGLVSLVVLTPSVLLQRGRHSLIGGTSHPFDVSMAKHPGMLLVYLWASLAVMGYLIAIFSLDSFATSALHISQTRGAALQSILASGQLIGRPVIGYLLDRYGRLNVTIVAYFLSGLSCLAIWIPARSFGVLVCFAICQGLVGGIVWSVSTAVVATMVPPAEVASAYSLLWLFTAIPSLVAQPIAIALLQYSERSLHLLGPKAYYISIGLCGGLNLAAGVALYGAKRYKQRSWAIWVKA